MLLYGSTLFLSAFLLFAVQPLLGRTILPLFGGTPSVWTGCMLFFQVLLLAGYAYAHILAGRRSARLQVLVHLVLLAVSVAALSGLFWGVGKTAGDGRPTLAILGMLALLIGVPYFLLASSSPLLQTWFSRFRPDRSPYRLYSLSNAGSLLAILSYPLVIEPWFSLRSQTRAWCWGYAVFAFASVICAWRSLGSDVASAGIPAGPEVPRNASGDEGKPGRLQVILWLLLPACSSLLLLATTNQLCQDVTVVPLLWVLPLGLYLITFILCFHSPRWYSRFVFGTVYAVALAWTCRVLFDDVFADLRSQVVSASLTLFVACMICHGELVRLKPGARHLTAFYGAVAAGGALGGFVAAIIAPAVFRGYWEYHLGLLSAALLFLAALFSDRGSRLARGRPLAVWTCFAVGVLGLTLALIWHIQLVAGGNIEMSRNFFGVLRVTQNDKGNPRYDRLTLMHGRIQHGFQYLSPFRRNWPTTYYSAASGVGLALRYHPARVHDPARPGNLRVGIVGLGTGTLAAYGLRGDYFRFYEINPDVVRIARRYFTFLRDCSAALEVVPGDARIAMEREIRQGALQRFDVLAIDAFSGDAIPVHLLTRECLEIYQAHLKPDGILALHISSRYLDLAPVVRALAELHAQQGTKAVMISCAANLSEGVSASNWVLLTSNLEFLGTEAVRSLVRPWRPDDRAPLLWTDDYTNLLLLLKNQRDKLPH